MKPLYESILGSNGAGIKALAEKWCKEREDDIYNGHYEITQQGSKCFIRPKGGTRPPDLALRILYDTYDELPSYINFMGNDKIRVTLGGWSKNHYTLPKVKSFRGIPDTAASYAIITSNDILPAMSVKCEEFVLYNNCNGFEDLNIEFVKSTFSISKLDIRPRHLQYGMSLKNVTVKNMKYLNLQQGVLGDEFSKAMVRKAVMNKKSSPYEIPVLSEAVPIIMGFLSIYGGTGISMDDVERIDYSQQSKVVRHDDKWYRVKNW